MLLYLKEKTLEKMQKTLVKKTSVPKRKSFKKMQKPFFKITTICSKAKCFFVQSTKICSKANLLNKTLLLNKLNFKF